MYNFRLIQLIILLCLCNDISGQTAFVTELGQIYEPSWDNVRIEPSGRMSYIQEKSIFTSEDEGESWVETVTPFELRSITGSGYVKSYKGLSNGNYILHTRFSMFYSENDEWKSLKINGDSLYKSGPYVVDEKIYVVTDREVYSYNDDTKDILLELEFPEYSWPEMTVFKNHLLLKTDANEYRIYDKDLNYLATSDSRLYITEEGHFIEYERVYNSESYHGSKFNISYDKGQSYSVLYESINEEYSILGDIGGKLYFRGFIFQSEAWSSGHHQARTGYIDLATGELNQVYDGLNVKNYYFRSPVLNEHYYHNINGAIVKYVNGDLENRQVLLGRNETPVQIRKFRRASNGTEYAMTSSFLYKSADKGKTWDVLFDYHTVTDFDIDDEDLLYCISNDRLFRSEDSGTSFSELSLNYIEGHIDYPHSLLCLDNGKLMVKGIGISMGWPNVNVGCFDCYIYHPVLIFVTDDNGASWVVNYVDHYDYPAATADSVYGLPSDRAIQSYYLSQTAESTSCLWNNRLSVIDKSDLSRKYLQLPNERVFDNEVEYDFELDYGLTITGDLIKNEYGKVSASKDCGLSYTELFDTRRGQIFSGAQEESMFIISNATDSVGTLAYASDYDAFVPNLSVRLENASGALVPDDFERVYTDGVKEYLFSGTKTYRIKNIGLSDVSSVPEAASILYPNPVSENLYIEIQNRVVPFSSITVYDISGNLILTERVASSKFQFDLTNLESGVYILRINKGNQESTHRIVKI